MDDLHLRKIDTKEKEKVLSFLSSDVANCLYLFLDIEMYDLAGDTIDVWLQECENSTIVSVIMRYEDSFQLYCRETDLAKVEFESIATLLRSFDPMRISAPVGMIRGLYAYFSDDYEDSYGSIIELKKYRKFEDDNIKIEKATIDDMPEVVNLIMLDDELGQSYDYSSMVRQFQDRIKDGTGLNYIIRKDDKIVAHVAFSAISSSFVIVAYMIVHPEYRDFPYGAILDSYYINHVAPAMKKSAFAFMQDSRRIKLFELMGNSVIGKYGKFLKKQ